MKLAEFRALNIVIIPRMFCTENDVIVISINALINEYSVNMIDYNSLKNSEVSLYFCFW